MVMESPNISSVAPTFHQPVVLPLLVINREIEGTGKREEQREEEDKERTRTRERTRTTVLVVGFRFIFAILAIVSSARRGWGTWESQYDCRTLSTTSSLGDIFSLSISSKILLAALQSPAG